MSNPHNTVTWDPITQKLKINPHNTVTWDPITQKLKIKSKEKQQIRVIVKSIEDLKGAIASFAMEQGEMGV